jgi:hypothetical protein
MSKLKVLIALALAAAPAVLTAQQTAESAMPPGYRASVDLQTCCRVFIGGFWYCIPC